MPARGLLAASAAALLLAGCQAPPSATYNRFVYGDPAKDWLGMSKQQIIACAGSPYSSFHQGTTETLSYHYNGAGPTPDQQQQSKKKASGDAGTSAGGGSGGSGSTAGGSGGGGSPGGKDSGAKGSGTKSSKVTQAPGSTADASSLAAGPLAHKKDKNWQCEAALVFESDRLVRVNFAHRLVRSPYQWQSISDPKKQQEMKDEPLPTCTFSLPDCNPAQH